METSAMAQSIFLIVVFIGVLALFPLAIRWLQRRNGLAAGGGPAAAGMRVVSTLAVGPQQRLVTVEAGPEGARAWLVLGVTGASITCLHTVPLNGAPVGGAPAAAPVAANAPAPSFARLIEDLPRG
ncbi:MAG: flagellar biosynthetic protein FliO [Burkholderiaceae bacterium]|nr:flagellar biosynthetic protein FliO [Burkholderiaceae bacterium]